MAERRIPTPEQIRADCTRSASLDPTSYNEADNTIEIVFSTGASCRKMDWYEGTVYTEVLPLSGMDCSELNQGAHVLRSHNRTDVDWVIGSVVPGTARVVSDTEARARIKLSGTEGDRELVEKIKTGIVRKWSYGYEKIGQPVITFDPDSGEEIRTWAAHKPFEISAVAVPADGGTNTRSREEGAPAGARNQEAPMDPKDNEIQAPVDTKAIDLAARKAEKTRQDGIRAAARKARLTDEDVRAMLDDVECTVQDAGLKMLDLVAKRDADGPEIRSQVEVTRDQAETRMQGMIDAFAFRANPVGAPSDKAREYVGCRAVDFARECLENGGVRTRGMSPTEILEKAIFGTRGMHSTGDFPLLLSAATGKNFNAGFAKETLNFTAIATRRMVPNFKDQKELVLSGASTPDVTPEGKEIKYGTLTEGGETWNIVSLTKGLRASRQTLINDEMGVFGSIPERLGAAMARAIITRFWAMLIANANMADGEALFSTAHLNLTASSGGAPSVDQIKKGRLLLRQMKDLGGEVLNLVPSHIIIGSEWETDVDQLMTLIQAAQASNVTPAFIRSLQVIVEPRLDVGKFWYLAAASWPSLVYGYLEGNEAPRISSRESWDIQGVDMKIEHDFGCGVTDHRGLYRNKGAS